MIDKQKSYKTAAALMAGSLGLISLIAWFAAPSELERRILEKAVESSQRSYDENTREVFRRGSKTAEALAARGNLAANHPQRQHFQKIEAAKAYFDYFLEDAGNQDPTSPTVLSLWPLSNMKADFLQLSGNDSAFVRLDSIVAVLETRRTECAGIREDSLRVALWRSNILSASLDAEKVFIGEIKKLFKKHWPSPFSVAKNARLLVAPYEYSPKGKGRFNSYRVIQEGEKAQVGFLSYIDLADREIVARLSDGRKISTSTLPHFYWKVPDLLPGDSLKQVSVSATFGDRMTGIKITSSFWAYKKQQR